MIRKQIIVFTLVSIVALAFSAPAAWAGSPAQHRLEGAVIGIGALLLTKAIVDQHLRTVETVSRPAATYDRHRSHPRPSGHWNIQREWVPARYKRDWNPGHYNRHGAWISGHWKRVEVSPGHWTRKRVWVAYR